MASLVKRLFVMFIVLGLLQGCYSRKMMDLTYARMDSVQTTQSEILQKLDALTVRLSGLEAGGVNTDASTTASLDELRFAIEQLTFRIADTEQLILNQQGGTGIVPVPFPVPGAADTVLVDSMMVDVALSVDDSDSVRLYKGAYMDLTLGNYDLAVQGFKNYVVRFPGSPLMAEAHYYLGESYYSLDRYLEAVAEYQSVVKDYPASRLVPASYLKSGLSYQALDEQQLAERALRQLISKYPRSEEAEQARVALQGTEG